MNDEQQIPVPTPESQPYWDGCAAGELRLPRCVQCRRLHFFPRSFCPYCWSESLAWETVSGLGTVASFVRSHRRVPGFDLEPPFVIALIDLSEGVRLMSNVVGDPERVAVGTRVRAVFDTRRGDITLPRFVPLELPA